MYIRRKVFSLLEVEGEERYFSTTEFENVNDYEVRLFSDDEKKGMSKKEKAAIATGATLATAAALIGGGKMAGKSLTKSIADKLTEGTGKLTREEEKKLLNRLKLAENLQKPADVISEGAKGAWKGVKDGVKKAKDATEEAVQKMKDKLPKRASEEGGK